MEAPTMNISAKDVMALREKTGLGMMDCKEALAKNNNDMKAAEEWLRAKMKGKMDSRTERTTAEGRVNAVIRGGDAAIVEVRCETDFTSRNSDFLQMVTDVTNLVLLEPSGHVPATVAIGARVDDIRIKTGENMSYARGDHLSGESFGMYVHHDGKRGAVVQFEGGEVTPAVANDIAVHVVGFAPTPIGVNADDVAPEVLEKIRAEAIAEAKAGGKPDQIAQKMAEGRVAKYLKEVTLLDQPFVKDPTGKSAVKDLLPKGVKIVKFTRYVLGA